MKNVKHITYIAFVLSLLLNITSCSSDDIAAGDYIPPTSNINPLDHWIDSTLSKPYNISVKYKQLPYADPYSSTKVLADTAKVKTVLKAFLSLGVDAYRENLGDEFVKSYFPREIEMEGIPFYNEFQVEQPFNTQKATKILALYGINSFDPKNADDVYSLARRINYHIALILLERGNIDLSPFAQYNIQPYSSDWLQDVSNNPYAEKTSIMVEYGFASFAAQTNVYTDFAETFSLMVCRTQKEITTLLSTAQNGRRGEIARICLENKMNFINTFLSEKYNIRLSSTLSRTVPRLITNYTTAS